MNDDVCFGPCTDNFYKAVANKDTFVVECSRFYETIARNKGCDTQMKSQWDITLPAVNEFSGLDTAYNEGRGLEACEEVCAQSSSCEAFGISSQEHIALNRWQCIVYYACSSTQYNEYLDLYIRKEPKQCFAKATSYDGVFVNYLETNGIVSQTSRKLNVPIKKFMHLHLTVNGQYNGTTFGFQPYHTPRATYCTDNYDSDCILLHAGGFSALVMVIFVSIIAFNACIIWVIVERTSSNNTPSYKQTKLRKMKPYAPKLNQNTNTMRKRTVSGSSAIQF
tara:strand:+ start:469 stop:1305 length:837 start_codon:yes stop_codon:yes gene_type:complete